MTVPTLKSAGYDYLPGLVWLHYEGVARGSPLLHCMCHYHKAVCRSIQHNQLPLDKMSCHLHCHVHCRASLIEGEGVDMQEHKLPDS